MMSRRFATVVVLVVVLAFVVVSVAPAFAATPSGLVAHTRLLKASPANGSSVDTAEEVVLAFNEEVDEQFVKVTVEGPDGAEVDGEPQVDGREVTQALAADLPAGRHTVTYRVVSADGHPISGKVSFTTTVSPSPSPSPTASATATPTATDRPRRSPPPSMPSPSPTTAVRAPGCGSSSGRACSPRCSPCRPGGGSSAAPAPTRSRTPRPTVGPSTRGRTVATAPSPEWISLRPSAAANVFHRAPLAQLAEQLTLNQRVRGSSP